jgi:hypothetical protein
MATTCPHGHELAPPNVYVGVQRRWCKTLGRFVEYGRRDCRACQRKPDPGTGIRNHVQLSLQLGTTNL